ncbi:glycosyltransferase [Sphingobacterium spiritivorum]|uniref:glycosyltransferase n=1 Tax=Sphingobacterium spiritivorum TaxID=258 RepID=UPI003DA53486
MGLRRYFRPYIHKRRHINYLKKEYRYIDSNSSSIAGNEISFPVFEEPLVSIIIPLFHQDQYTRKCLSSIAAHLPGVSFELILIDNTKTPYFQDIVNIKLISNAETTGFISSVNKGIEIAKGDYVYILDNRTVVLDGFLDELLYVFDNNNNVGAVTSMLINPDGTLQGAGGLFLADSQSEEVNNPAIYHPVVNYVRKIDYAPNCSLLFKRLTEDGEVNLLDKQSEMPGTEGSEICFNLKYLQNKDIYYTPFSKVIHFDESRIKKKSGQTDKKPDTLKTNWTEKRRKIKAVSSQQRVLELYKNKNIVFFHDRIPQFDNNSGDLRLTEIIAAFRKLGYHITLVVRHNRIDNTYCQYFRRSGVCVIYDYRLFNELPDFLKSLNFSSPLCWFSTSTCFMRYYKPAKEQWPNAKTIFDMVDIHHLRYKRALEHEPENKDFIQNYAKYLKEEQKAAQLADIIVPISDQEAQYMREFSGRDEMVVISNIHYTKVTIAEIPDFEEREGIFFIGSQHHPNIDAVRFLAHEIMPLIWSTHPEIHLHIVGNLNLVMEEIKHPQIHFYGYVPDVSKHYRKHRLMVAPLRSGAGVKGKIGQAFEYFMPVVTSKIGAEGMNMQDNVNALLAEDAQEFAAKIIQLYTNKEVWHYIQSNSEDSLTPFSKENLYKKIQEIEQKY